jgi:hypothetical protein
MSRAVHFYRYSRVFHLALAPRITHLDLAKNEGMLIMTDISFSAPARLLASESQIAQQALHHAGAVDRGSLGRLVGKVMEAEPGGRWRYAIAADGVSQLYAAEIEALAGTRQYADWQAGQV